MHQNAFGGRIRPDPLGELKRSPRPPSRKNVLTTLYRLEAASRLNTSYDVVSPCRGPENKRLHFDIISPTAKNIHFGTFLWNLEIFDSKRPYYKFQDRLRSNAFGRLMLNSAPPPESKYVGGFSLETDFILILRT